MFEHLWMSFCRPNGEADVSSFEKSWLLSIFLFSVFKPHSAGAWPWLEKAGFLSQ